MWGCRLSVSIVWSIYLSKPLDLEGGFFTIASFTVDVCPSSLANAGFKGRRLLMLLVLLWMCVYLGPGSLVWPMLDSEGQGFNVASFAVVVRVLDSLVWPMLNVAGFAVVVRVLDSL